MEPQQLGKYHMIERLGRGGMGEVWKARDTQLQRYVAIKLLNADLQADPEFVTHFMREAQLVASLHHPNIVQVHDFQLTDTRGSSIKAYMVMDYIEGGTLADYIRATSRKGLFPPAAEIVYLFTAISLALDYAHKQGMIHRDIKPANILLDRPATSGKLLGEPILTDFGIARLQDAHASTMTQGLLGTPLYVSPEQAEGHALDKRADLYSLGIILYEILTGVTPFRSGSPLVIMMQHVHEQATPPALINPTIPPALSAVVLQSIAKNPQARFPSANAMTVELAQALNVAVPASLSASTNANPPPGYNPLQPSRVMPGATFSPPTVMVSPFSPAAQSLPGSAITPPVITPTRGVQEQLPSSTSTRAKRGKLYLVLAACLVLALIGISAFTAIPSLFHRANSTSTPTAGDLVVGHITFMSSPGVPRNTFDQLRVDLANIPAPPANTTYYGWLENANSEATNIPRWLLAFSNGAIHGTFSSSPPRTDLFAGSVKFLITNEDANSQPLFPRLERAGHLYYAIISHTSQASPIFEVRQCPRNSPGSGTDPCP